MFQKQFLLILKTLSKILEKVHKGIVSGIIISCHDISEGGLITAIFEMCVGGNCGASIKVLPKDVFAETAGCFIVELEDEISAEKLFKGIPYKILGKTIKE